MKKKVLIGVSGIFVIILGICICFYMGKDNSDDEMYTSNIEDEKENSIGGFLTLMLETEAGSGVYEKSISSTWPGEGYVFNENLSSCENGGELSWNEELGAVNLKTNNTEKCYVYFDKEPDIVYLADYIINNVYVEDGVNALYYHDGQGTYTNATQEAGDYSYRYTGGDYKIAESYQEIYSQIYGEIIKMYCDGTEISFGTTYCTGNMTFTLDYDANNVYYITVSDALEQAVNDGYLIGDNIKNYVCFGSDAATCPNDNLYRIIGVFNDTGEYQVKLIKADIASSNLLGTNGDYLVNDEYAEEWGKSGYYKGKLDQSTFDSYGWNFTNFEETYAATNSYNIWSYSALNTVNLNQNFLANIGSKWSAMISTHSWKVGGVSQSNGSGTPRTVYNYEVGANSSNTTYDAKIGLMYMSDYGFASSTDNWTDGLEYYGYDGTNRENNWMFMGIQEYTISRYSEEAYSPYIFGVYNDGIIRSFYVTGSHVVRPVFYLNSNVAYSSGSGIESDPIRLVV